MRTPLHTNRPQYFHLLWDEEIERLQGVLRLIQTHHTEVLERWYQLYTVHLGEAAALSQHEFQTLYGQDLTHTLIPNRYRSRPFTAFLKNG